MRRLVVRTAARLDIVEIGEYIAADNILAAVRVLGEIEEAIAGLQEMPGKGHQRSDLTDPYARFWSVYSYLIIYEYDDDTVTILRVIHGRRAIEKWIGHN
jgi:toxin ParE1/3/4